MWVLVELNPEKLLERGRNSAAFGKKFERGIGTPRGTWLPSLGLTVPVVSWLDVLELYRDERESVDMLLGGGAGLDRDESRLVVEAESAAVFDDVLPILELGTSEFKPSMTAAEGSGLSDDPAPIGGGRTPPGAVALLSGMGGSIVKKIGTGPIEFAKSNSVRPNIVGPSGNVPRPGVNGRRGDDSAIRITVCKEGRM